MSWCPHIILYAKEAFKKSRAFFEYIASASPDQRYDVFGSVSFTVFPVFPPAAKLLFFVSGLFAYYNLSGFPYCVISHSVRFINPISYFHHIFFVLKYHAAVSLEKLSNRIIINLVNRVNY